MEKIKEWIALRLTKDNSTRWNFSEKFKGRYKNFEVLIISASIDPYSFKKDYYYFTVDSKKYPDIRFNSLWEDNGKFASAADAHDAVVQWIDNKVKELKKE